jgi:hypothetical protein
MTIHDAVHNAVKGKDRMHAANGITTSSTGATSDASGWTRTETRHVEPGQEAKTRTTGA